MTPYRTEQQRKIIDAFIYVAAKAEKAHDVTMIKIAEAAGLTSQAIYRNYFKNVDEIISTERQIVVEEIAHILELAHEENYFSSPLALVADNLLPFLYENHVKFKILYRQDIATDWFATMEKYFVNWSRPYLRKDIQKMSLGNNDFVLSVSVKFILTLLSSWMSEEIPEPPRLFRQKFLTICKFSNVANFIDPIYYDHGSIDFKVPVMKKKPDKLSD